MKLKKYTINIRLPEDGHEVIQADTWEVNVHDDLLIHQADEQFAGDDGALVAFFLKGQWLYFIAHKNEVTSDED